MKIPQETPCIRIGSIPLMLLIVYAFLSKFNDINLSDNQTALFNTIRKSMTVIQFYLINIAFPKESKQFDCKIIATSCIHALSKPIRSKVVSPTEQAVPHCTYFCAQRKIKNANSVVVRVSLGKYFAVV